MFITTALLFPFMVSLTWAIIVLLQTDKNDAQKHLAWLLAITAVYFFIDASYLVPLRTHHDYVNLVYLDIISQYITTFLPPSITMFLSVLAKGKKFTPFQTFISFLPGVLLGTTAAVIYFSMGVHNAAEFISATDLAQGSPVGYNGTLYKLQELFCQKIYNIVLLTEIIITIIYGVRILLIKRNITFTRILDFFKGKFTVDHINIVCLLILILLAICSVRIALGRQYLLVHINVSAVLSLLLGTAIFLIGYISNWFPDRDFNLWDFKHPATLRNKIAKGDDKRAQAPGIKPVKSSKERKARTREEQFIEYMESEKPFLNPELTITDVADALHSNRTYVSLIVNENFEMTFKDYLSKQRIEYAKKIMAESPDEILATIAEKSGFLSDSQFSKKFKELEGLSPKAWIQERLSKGL